MYEVLDSVWPSGTKIQLAQAGFEQPRLVTDILFSSDFYHSHLFLSSSPKKYLMYCITLLRSSAKSKVQLKNSGIAKNKDEMDCLENYSSMVVRIKFIHNLFMDVWLIPLLTCKICTSHALQRIFVILHYFLASLSQQFVRI